MKIKLFFFSLMLNLLMSFLPLNERSDGITIKLDMITICLYLGNPEWQSRTSTSRPIHLLLCCIFRVVQYTLLVWPNTVKDAVSLLILLNPLLHRYSFWHINNRQLLKTLWENNKLLVISNFSFSHNVFYSIR